jgi:hypothetical protein
MARPRVSHVALGDPIDVLVHWQLESGWIPHDSQLGATPLSSRELANSIEVRIVHPDASETRHRLSDAVERGNQVMFSSSTFVLRLESKPSTFPPALMSSSPIAKSWQGAAPKLVSLGHYRITISGVLPTSPSGERFETVAIPVEVVQPSDELLSEKQLYDKARPLLEQVSGQSFDSFRRIFEVPGGNRVITVGASIWEERFGGTTWWQLEVRPDGTPVKMTTDIAPHVHHPRPEYRRTFDAWTTQFELLLDGDHVPLPTPKLPAPGHI